MRLDGYVDYCVAIVNEYTFFVYNYLSFRPASIVLNFFYFELNNILKFSLAMSNFEHKYFYR